MKQLLEAMPFIDNFSLLLSPLSPYLNLTLLNECALIKKKVESDKKVREVSMATPSYKAALKGCIGKKYYHQ